MLRNIFKVLYFIYVLAIIIMYTRVPDGNWDSYKDIENTILFTKSILVAVPVSYLFFLPFFFAKSFNMNFFLIYGTGLGFIVVGFFIHKYITNFL